MVNFKTRVFFEEEQQIIGAEVIVQSENGDKIGAIQIVDEQELNALRAQLDVLDSTYIKRGELSETLNNAMLTTPINATKLNGLESDKFAKTNHSHNYSPLSHAAPTNMYGVGSTTDYGHCKTIDNLNSKGYIAGEALSAKQGKVLNDKINNVANKNGWSSKKTINSFASYSVNPDLRLVSLSYNREDYTGFKSSSGHKTLHTNFIPDAYRPGTRLTIPIYRGDVVASISGRNLLLHSLRTFPTIGVHFKMLWKY